MNIENITYVYDKKTFKKALLRHLTPITILTFGQCFLALIFGILGIIAYVNNDKTMFLAMENQQWYFYLLQVLNWEFIKYFFKTY